MRLQRFDSEGEALEALYDQLFGDTDSMCKDTIYHSMEYLIFSKKMRNQMMGMRRIYTSPKELIFNDLVTKRERRSIRIIGIIIMIVVAILIYI